MIIIEMGHNTGKTTILLHYMVCNPNSFYVTRTEEYAKRTSIKAQELGLDLPPERFKSMTDPDLRDLHGHGYKIIVDDVDFIIKQHPLLGYKLIAIADIITISKGEI